jgi:hypothetical protein
MFTNPALLLKIEEAILLAATILIYHHFQFSWLLFAILFLSPDLFMLGYLANLRLGSALYNLGHTLFIPLSLFIAAYFTHHSLLISISVIWLSHIAFDRLLGYGLKYPTYFKDTHLQRIA